MSQAVSTTKENQTRGIRDALKIKTCNRCGGNGYMKSSPNCYHTCLTCLGKGLISEKCEIIN